MLFYDFFNHLDSFLSTYTNEKTLFENSINDIISTYPTDVYENRFIVGGAIEQLFGFLVQRSGLRCSAVGSTTIGFDLLVDGVGKVSIKYSSKSAIKIRNSLGENKIDSVEENTVFILPDKNGVFFVGIEDFDPAYLTNKKDGLSLKRSFFGKGRDFHKINCNFRKNDKLERRIASQEIATAIIIKNYGEEAFE